MQMNKLKLHCTLNLNSIFLSNKPLIFEVNKIFQVKNFSTHSHMTCRSSHFTITTNQVFPESCPKNKQAKAQSYYFDQILNNIYKKSEKNNTKTKHTKLLIPTDILRIIISYSQLIPKWVPNDSFLVKEKRDTSQIITKNINKRCIISNYTLYSQNITLTTIFPQMKINIKHTKNANVIFGIVKSNTHCKQYISILQHNGYFIDGQNIYSTMPDENDITTIKIIKKYNKTRQFQQDDIIKAKISYTNKKQLLLTIQLNNKMLLKNYKMKNNLGSKWMLLLCTITKTTILCK